MRERYMGCLRVGIGMMITMLLCGVAPKKDVQARPKAQKVMINTGSNLLINKKEKKRLQITVTPKKASKSVRWTSSRKKIVSVNAKGRICGKRYGKAVITARMLDGSGKQAKIKVEVGRKVTQVQMPVQTMILNVGAKQSLQAKVLPANATRKKVLYESSNKSLVSVSSTGVVEAKAKGTAIITVSTTDGSQKKAVCKVQAVIPTQSVSLQAGSTQPRIQVGEKITIMAAVKPADASNTAVRYTSTNPAVATVAESGLVTGVAPGVTTIRVDSADGYSTASVDVEVYKVELKDEKLIAHRGYSSMAPENTTAAFRLAVENGFWGVECDVRKTLDDEFVIMHDADLGRMCGKSFSVANLDITQLKNCKIVTGSNIENYPDLTIPTLAEYLEIVASSETIHPFIELKEAFTKDELIEIVDIVDSYGLMERAYFISIYQSNLLNLKEIDKVKKDQLQYVYGAEADNKTLAVDVQVIDWCIQNAVDLDARHTLVSASDVSRLQEAGRKVNVWTVNDLQKAYNLVTNVNVDMITTEKMLNS